MDIQLFDNYDEDGQLSLFHYDDSMLDMTEEMQEENEPAGNSSEKDRVERTVEKKAVKPASEKSESERAAVSAEEETFAASAGSKIRIQRCGTCGKLLFVKEETTGYEASCNNCGIEYFQKL